MINVPTIKTGDWDGIRRAIQILARQLQNPTFMIVFADTFVGDSAYFKKVEIDLPDGLTHIKNKEVHSAPFDEVLGAYLVG